MMKFKRVQKWLIRTVIVGLLMTFFTYLWMDHKIDEMWGAHTIIVDHKRFDWQQQNILITNVNVLSADGESMLSDQNVLIKHGKIVALNSADIDEIGVKIIDGKNQFLIPGLIDSHVHLWQSENDLLLYLANGVTHIRELNGSQLHLKWKNAIENGRMGPRMYVASSRVNSNGLIKGWFNAWTAKINSVNEQTDMNVFVKKLQKKGYDAIKIYTFINNDDYYRLLDAAQQFGMEIIGHLPINLTLKQLWQTEHKSLAHIEELVKVLNREFGGYGVKTIDEFLQFVEKRSTRIAQQLATKNMTVVSTLFLMESFVKQKSDLDHTLKSVQLRYVNPGISEGSVLADRVMGWLPEENIYRHTHEHSKQQLKENQLYWQSYAEANRIILRALQKSGVNIMAGTDANVPVAVPGFSMHDELKSLTKAGLTNAQALRSATSAPAEMMQVKSGKILPGYHADLILLSANPLLDISNTQSIESVISNGRYLDRANLDGMLDAVEAANDMSRKTDIKNFE